MARTPILAANWKMNLGKPDDALDFIREIRNGLNEVRGIDLVLCPPHTVLHQTAELLAPTRIKLGAQNGHWDAGGAQTGEISMTMLCDTCVYVILGHSERRASGSEQESDAAINRKVRAALELGMTPIICVGENLEQNQTGQTHEFVSGQIKAAFAEVSAEAAARCVVAYEPIWAIGTGKAASPTEANRIIGLTVRGTLSEMYGEEIAQFTRIQYGGSVTADNIAEFMVMPDIDGALVGGASLKPEFVELARQTAG